MITHFKAPRSLVATVQTDLRRRHPFAYERIGFIAAGLSWCDAGLLIFACDYRPVEDGDYLRDPSVGAMMGPDAIRKAMQWTMTEDCALLHVHEHSGRGVPNFSSVDLKENAKFVPGFFNVSPQCPHGAIVLSHDAARGQLWLAKSARPIEIDRFTIVGAPLKSWGM
jgi:hypothetical protein